MSAMGTFGAAFVQAGDDGPARAAEIARALREQNTAWLAASPENLAIEYTVRRSAGTPWISIQHGIPFDLLQKFSCDMGATAIGISGCDEIILGFSYRRFDSGRVRRALDYRDNPPRGPAGWMLVEGEREPWEEQVLFSNKLIGLYFKYAPKEADRAVSRRIIEQGASIPWSSDADIVGEIAAYLQLPWRPVDDTFPPATQTEVVAGSPDRWKKFHRRFRPWWKFW
jgi:hypothetical protein